MSEELKQAARLARAALTGWMDAPDDVVSYDQCMLNALKAVAALDHALNQCDVPSVDQRIADLEAELAPYREAEERAMREAAVKDRVEQIASFLFPKYDSVGARSDHSIKPPQWHEKSWWWNGVSIKWHKSELSMDGGYVNLSSYVGGGETEEIDLTIPKAWIEAPEDKWHDLVTDFRDQQVIKRAKEKVARAAAEAQHQIAAAQETLRQLGIA